MRVNCLGAGCVSQPEHSQGFLYSLASNTFLKIIAVPKMADFWIVSIEMLMSSISRCAESLAGTLPSAPTTIGTTLHLTPHSLPSSLHSSLYFSMFSFSLVVTLVSPGTAMSTIRHSLVSLFKIQDSRCLLFKTQCSEPWYQVFWPLSLSQWRHWSPRIALLCHSHWPFQPSAGTTARYVQGHVFFARPQWTAVATLSCLPLYSDCAILLHSETMWLTVWSACLHIRQRGDVHSFSIFAVR